ncbi:MAG: hypothetical protein ACJ8EW_11170, partial [Rhizobium sp.]|uniref:hypothetical protein n=1 Tax=Rhizobium sp. TaxID=391 RepID=UPI00389A2B8B
LGHIPKLSVTSTRDQVTEIFCRASISSPDESWNSLLPVCARQRANLGCVQAADCVGNVLSYQTQLSTEGSDKIPG